MLNQFKEEMRSVVWFTPLHSALWAKPGEEKGKNMTKLLIKSGCYLMPQRYAHRFNSILPDCYVIVKRLRKG